MAEWGTIPRIDLVIAESSVEDLAAAISESLTSREADDRSPWMTTEEAAVYLRCPVSRIKKLASTGDLPREKDGSRNLFHRDALDKFVRNGGAISP